MFGAYAEKQGGGKSFLFGRKTWKKRWFVVDSERRIGYWESEAHQRSNSPPLKPHLGLDGSVVDVPTDSVVVGDRQVWPFTLRFAEGSGDKAELSMRTEDKPSRDKFVQALISVGVKATGGGVPPAASSPSAGGAGSSGSDSGSGSGDAARGEIKSSTGRVAPVVLSVEGEAAAAAAAAVSSGSASGSGAAARPAALDAGSSSTTVAPARDVAFSSGSGKTPPPPPPRLTSTSIGTPRRPGAPGSGLAGIDATLPASAAAPAAAVEAAKTEPAPAAADESADAAAPASASASRESAAPPGVPKPSAPAGAPPPEVEAAAREAQLAIMEREEQLPPGWTIGSSADGYVFYVSPTGESQWDKPTA